MDMHSLDVLGAPIMIAEKLLLCTWQKVLPIPNINKRKQSYQQGLSQELGMLLPEQSSFFSIFKDEEDGMFVKAQNDDILYVLHCRWYALKSCIPKNTCVFVIVFKDVLNTLRMGVYDMLVVDNQSMTKSSILDRHTMLHNVWKQTQNDSGINLIDKHWVGYVHACYSCLQNPQNLPFRCHNILLLNDNVEEDQKYDLLIRPIQTVFK